MLGDKLNTVITGDSLEQLAKLPDESIDLIIIDPPYNIGKDPRWDKWDDIDAYVEFMGAIFEECDRILKETGSFYWFHNDMAQIRRLMDEIDERTAFVYKQFIVWNKRFDGARIKDYLDGHVAIKGLRNYKQMAEYCLFYTKQEDLNEVIHDINKFKQLRKYFADLLNATGLSKAEIMRRVGQRADHCFRSNSTQWDLPTRETYEDIIKLVKCDKFKIKKFDELLREYETKRIEYESLRYTFNNQRTHHSVWNYEVAPKQGHITPKPIDLIENIIRHSSNEGDVVLDCFLGSGTTAVAAVNLGRNYIGIEREPEYVEIARQRIDEALVEKQVESNG